MHKKCFCCFLSEEEQSKARCVCVYICRLKLLTKLSTKILTLDFRIYVGIKEKRIRIRIIHGKSTHRRSCFVQQTIFTKITRSEKVDLEVFIGVEQVKASRQLYSYFFLTIPMICFAYLRCLLCTEKA